MKVKIGKALPSRLVLATITVIGLVAIVGVYGLSIILSQSFTSPGSAAAIVTSTCSGPLALLGSTPVQGTSNAMQLVCPTSGNAPINSIGGNVTPNFSVSNSTELTGLGLTLHGGNCSTGIIALSTGVPVSLAAGSYDYCLFYASYSKSATLNISWSQ